MKGFFLYLLLLMSIITAQAQGQSVKHVVQRGETHRSIAQKYGITEDELRAANLKVKRFYAGMELVILGLTKSMAEDDNKEVSDGALNQGYPSDNKDKEHAQSSNNSDVKSISSKDLERIAQEKAAKDKALQKKIKEQKEIDEAKERMTQEMLIPAMSKPPVEQRTITQRETALSRNS